MLNDKVLKQSVFYTFIIGLICHGYCFLNTIMSHDALNNIYIATKWNKLKLGRFFYPVYLDLFRGRLLVPWLIGILALLWISVAVYLIVEMFHIRRTVMIAAVAGICVANPTVCSMAATYLHDLDADMFAMMLAVFSVFLWRKAIEKTNVKHKTALLVIGAFLVSGALGIYQSFISVTIVLIMLLCIRDVLEGKEFLRIFQCGMWGIFMLVMAAVFYVLEIVFFSNYTGISIMENTNYNGMGNMADSLTGGILNSIMEACLDFTDAFKALLTVNGSKWYLAAHVVIAVAILALAVWRMLKIQWSNRILLCFLGSIMPLAMNVTYVMSGGLVHDLMRYSFWFIYLVALVFVMYFLENARIAVRIKNGVYLAVMASLCIVMLGNIRTSNSVYMKKHLEYQGTLSYMTRVADRMESMETYIPGETPVLFVGEDAIGKSRNGFENYEEITGVGYDSSLTFYDTYDQYFEYVLGLPLNFCEDAELMQDERVLEMPIFPKDGSVAMLDGILVVKLGEVYAEN